MVTLPGLDGGAAGFAVQVGRGGGSQCLLSLSEVSRVEALLNPSLGVTMVAQ